MWMLFGFDGSTCTLCSPPRAVWIYHLPVIPTSVAPLTVTCAACGILVIVGAGRTPDTFSECIRTAGAQRLNRFCAKSAEAQQSTTTIYRSLRIDVSE